MIIDFHLHLGKGEPGAPPLQRNLFPQTLIQIMDEAGVDKGVVFPVTYRDYWAANQELKGYVDSFPERLVLFGRVGNTADAAEIMERSVSELGAKGFKIHHGLDRFEPDSPNLLKALEAAERLQVPIIFDAFGLERVRWVAGYAKKFSFPVILGHMGGLWNVAAIDEAIAAAESCPNAYLETSSVLLFRKIEEAVERVGAERILFGTDGPGVHPAPEIAKIRCLHISDEAKTAILGQTARRLLHL
jgi:predicted TIM-barrel fold metal-dependent hydrolase